MSIFNKNNKRKMIKNKFDLSHQVLTTANWGELRPFYVQEVIPGDSFRVSQECLVRLQPLLYPTMARIDIKFDYFYVPYHQIWDEWKDFIRGGDSSTENPPFPTLTVDASTRGSFGEGTLADFLGMPPVPQTGTFINEHEINALPFRAYNHIWNEWYRDQDLQADIPTYKETSGNHTMSSTHLAVRLRHYAKDYFTSCRPHAQKGDPVNYLGVTYNGAFLKYADGTQTGQYNVEAKYSAGTGTFKLLDGGTLKDVVLNAEGTIQELRRAEAMQSYLERLQRSGNRYREWLAGIFGVTADDQELDIPQYLGGYSQPVTISEVLQTAPEATSGTTDPDSGVGEMHGHGMSVGNAKGFSNSFKYHGLVIGIQSIVPKASYSYGLDKLWKRFDRFDYYLPDFALIGEQAVLEEEVYVDWLNKNLTSDVFGYQQRYAEYKYGKSRITGQMRDGTLRTWHLDRDFVTKPLLNSSFTVIDEDYNDLDRIFQVQSGDPFLVQMYLNVDAIRPMPYEAIPDLT